MIERYWVKVHAYVLMGSHYHLIVRTPEASLSAAVQWLNVAYSMWWNRRHGRSGHLFGGGRFKAVLVQRGEWVLACSGVARGSHCENWGTQPEGWIMRR